jgi:hypothetical protein
MKRLAKVHFIAFALLLMLTPLIACTPPEEAPPPPPTGNQSPVINSITAKAPIIIPNAETQITCDASDPDGDPLIYTWTASGGTITKTYQTYIFWKAPDFDGDFEINVTVEDGQGGTAEGSYTMNVMTTQPPVIDSVIAEPATLERGATSTVTCNAHDPDGDQMSYSWSASGGTISGTGKTATWKAPTTFGEFIITVSINDGKGGITEGTCQISVPAPVVTVTLDPIPDESGSVYNDGRLIPEFRLGDDNKNKGVRPFFSFDITEFAGAEIQEAKLTFSGTTITANPWLISPFIYVDLVDYGAHPLSAAAFNTTTVSVIESYNQETPEEILVKTHLGQVLENHKTRFQVRLRMGTDENQNTLADYIEFSNVELTVTYVK